MWNVQSFQSGEGPSRRPRALCFSKAKGSAWSVNILVPLHPSKTQQYDCKWYIPLTDLNFQMVDELEAVPNIPLVPDEELDALKIKISQIKSDIQREKVRPILESLCQVLWSLSTGQASALSLGQASVPPQLVPRICGHP